MYCFQLLQQRTWLIHWSLFVFFNHAKGRDEIIDLFLYQAPYLNAIQTMCPWILRYLTTAVITNKRRRQVQKLFYHHRQSKCICFLSRKWTLADLLQRFFNTFSPSCSIRLFQFIVHCLVIVYLFHPSLKLRGL